MNVGMWERILHLCKSAKTTKQFYKIFHFFKVRLTAVQKKLRFDSLNTVCYGK